jgi:uncharacterized membrane protein HdeD (DUF308 family)
MALSLRRRETAAPISVPSSDRIEERPRSQGVIRWALALRIYMRILSVLWIAKGLAAWTVILGVSRPSGAFEALALSDQVAVVYFGIIDLVAAVGLWMASTWGGVIWLLAVMSHLILSAFLPHQLSEFPALSVIMGGTLAPYLVLSWISAREEQV